MERKSRLFCYKKQVKRRKFQQLQLFYSHATVLNVAKNLNISQLLGSFHYLPTYEAWVYVCVKKTKKKRPNLAVPTTSRLNKFSSAIFFLVEKVVLSHFYPFSRILSFSKIVPSPFPVILFVQSLQRKRSEALALKFLWLNYLINFQRHVLPISIYIYIYIYICIYIHIHVHIST